MRDGLRQLTTSLPDAVTRSPDGFEYYAEIVDGTSGGRLRVPSGGATYRSYAIPEAIEVDLAARPPASTRRGTRIVSAQWGAGDGDVGMESGRSANPIGVSSFDVTTDGTVLLLDEAHRRALRWPRGARRPSSIPLSISGRLADMTIAEDGSIYVVETVARPGSAPLIRRFDELGNELDVVEAAEASPSQIRAGRDGPLVLQHPSHLWMPVASDGTSLGPGEQRRRGTVGRPLRSGAEVVTFRTSHELRLALLTRGRVEGSWRVVSPTPLAEVQLAEPFGRRLVVVVRVYDDQFDEFRVLVLDRRGLVRQFSIASADWAETAPLSRFRLLGGDLYQLGSSPDGVFVDRYDTEVE